MPAPFEPLARHATLTSSLPVSSSSALQGDSGGPLVASTADNKQVLVGITSFGSRGCSEPVSYFVRVQDYMSWINAALGAN